MNTTTEKKLIAKMGLNKNVIRDAKIENGKAYCWVPSKGWQRCRLNQVEAAK